MAHSPACFAMHFAAISCWGLFGLCLCDRDWHAGPPCSKFDEVSLLQLDQQVHAETQTAVVNWGDENPAMIGWPPLQRASQDPRVVISLSTVPGGVLGLGPTLRSLQNQTFPADAIELNLPKVSNRGLGEYPELSPADAGGIDVYRTPDWLALSNVVPTIERARAQSENILLIVVDDDKVYPPTLVEDHVRAHRNQPRSANTCRGYLMPPGGDISTAVFFPAWDELFHSVYGHGLGAKQQVAVLTGSDSWSAPIEVFSEGLWADLHIGHFGDNANATIEEAASLMNDVWVSGHLSRHNVPKFVVPCRRETRASPSQLLTSRQGQNLRRKRQDLNQAVMQFYKADWTPAETMPVKEVKRYPWSPTVKHVAPKQRSFFSWLRTSMMRGGLTVFLGF